MRVYFLGLRDTAERIEKFRGCPLPCLPALRERHDGRRNHVLLHHLLMLLSDICKVCGKELRLRESHRLRDGTPPVCEIRHARHLCKAYLSAHLHGRGERIEHTTKDERSRLHERLPKILLTLSRFLRDALQSEEQGAIEQVRFLRRKIDPVETDATLESINHVIVVRSEERRVGEEG